MITISTASAQDDTVLNTTDTNDVELETNNLEINENVTTVDDEETLLASEESSTSDEQDEVALQSNQNVDMGGVITSNAVRTVKGSSASDELSINDENDDVALQSNQDVDMSGVITSNVVMSVKGSSACDSNSIELLGEEEYPPWWHDPDDDGLDVVYVDPTNGNDNVNDGSSWDAAVATINKAVEYACNKGTIYLAPGTYDVSGSYSYPAVTVNKKGIKIIGQTGVIFTASSSYCAIEIGHNNISISNCVFSNCPSSYLINTAGGDNITLFNCTFVNNTGILIGAEGGLKNIINCTFIKNTASYLIYARGYSPSLFVANSTFINNTASSSGVLAMFLGLV